MVVVDFVGLVHSNPQKSTPNLRVLISSTTLYLSSVTPTQVINILSGVPRYMGLFVLFSKHIKRAPTICHPLFEPVFNAQVSTALRLFASLCPQTIPLTFPPPPIMDERYPDMRELVPFLFEPPYHLTRSSSTPVYSRRTAASFLCFPPFFFSPFFQNKTSFYNDSSPHRRHKTSPRPQQINPDSPSGSGSRCHTDLRCQDPTKSTTTSPSNHQDY